MAYRNNPMVQARIHQARQKKQQQLRITANVAFVRGAKAGATAAQELIAQGFSHVYEFESLVLHHLNIIDADHRFLRGSDIKKPHYAILAEAKALIPTEAPTEEQFIAASIPLARTADEAWILHRELTEIYRADLPEERRAQLAAAITERFPN